MLLRCSLEKFYRPSGTGPWSAPPPGYSIIEYLLILSLHLPLLPVAGVQPPFFVLSAFIRGLRVLVREYLHIVWLLLSQPKNIFLTRYHFEMPRIV